MTDNAVPADLIDFANTLADAAGAVISGYFRSPFDVIQKADESPVTIADREAEAAIRALIEEHYPDHGIYGEEYGQVRTDSRYVWVLDPIDGTRAFVTGMPIFGTLIGLADNGVPVLGVLDQPILKERWVGTVGHGTTYNGHPVSVRDCGDLDAASLYMTSPDQLDTPERESAFGALYESVKERRFGGDCYSTGLLASGFIDLHVECGVQPYDYMALVPVIQAAGGIATTWSGEQLTISSGDTFIGAACESVHQAAVRHLTPGQ